MRFANPFARKSRTPLGRWPVGFAGVAVSGDTPRNYEAQVRAAYLANPVGQRAVRMVAESAASAPLNVSSEAAALIARPSRTQVRSDFIETIASHLLLHGNAFIEVARGAAGRPAALYPLRPERVSVEADAAGWPAAHVYRAGNDTTRWPVSGADGRGGLLHLKAFHPLDDHYGLGSLGPSARAVALHNAAARWNTALLDNAARPSGALTFEAGDGTLSAAQFDRLRQEMEAHFSGSANAGRPLLLEGGLKWQALSLTPAEMDFTGLREAAARDIALAFGVPPMLLGLPGDSTYANYREAGVALWRLTVLPLLAKITEGLTAYLQAWWPELTIAVDVDSVAALAGDREKLWAQVAGADFLDRDEKRAAVGM